MSNKSEAKGGNQKVIFNLFSNISSPVKLLGAAATVVGLSYGTAHVKDLGNKPTVQRIENVQIADAETRDALKEILTVIKDTRKVVGETREKVIENSTKIEAVQANQEEMKKRIDKNETDIERVERRDN